MKNNRILYFASIAITVIIFYAFEAGAFPIGMIDNTPEVNYGVNLLCISTAIGGCFALLYCFQSSYVQRYINAAESKLAEQRFHRIVRWRIILWLLLMLFNIVMHYEALYASNTKYTTLILFIAGIFCYPPKTSPQIKTNH